MRIEAAFLLDLLDLLQKRRDLVARDCVSPNHQDIRGRGPPDTVKLRIVADEFHTTIVQRCLASDALRP